MLSQDQELLKKLSIKDLERTNAYLNDLTHGLELIRTFPQGVTIFGSARLPQDHKYCKQAFKLGRLLAENGHTVITGGGPGIMEAASHGAYEIGGRTIGLNIVLLHEQHPNPYLTEYMNFQYFFTRKVSLAMAAKVFVFFPGGFGTMDELSEILCLMQELKMPKMPIFLIGKEFWRNFDRALRKMQDLALIGPKDDQIFEVTNDIDKVVATANKLGHPKISENYYDGFRESTLLSHAKKLSARTAGTTTKVAKPKKSSKTSKGTH